MCQWTCAWLKVMPIFLCFTNFILPFFIFYLICFKICGLHSLIGGILNAVMTVKMTRQVADNQFLAEPT